MSPSDRFWSKVDASGDCWVWTAARQHEGYGQFWHDGRQVGAHRFAWEEEHGPIPAGMEVDHVVCDNPPCVRPSHLTLATGRRNVLRSTSNPTAINARLERCRRGHEFSRTDRDGRRICRTCQRDRMRAHRERTAA